MNKPTMASRLRNACIEMRRKPFPISDLIPMLQEAADRIDLLEKLDRDAANNVEATICTSSRHFTGKPPYVGWEGLGTALRQDYHLLNLLEATHPWPVDRSADAYGILEVYTAGQWEAYDYAFAGAVGAVNRILDGHDKGQGVSGTEWEPLRRRLLDIMARIDELSNSLVELRRKVRESAERRAFELIDSWLKLGPEGADHVRHQLAEARGRPGDKP